MASVVERLPGKSKSIMREQTTQLKDEQKIQYLFHRADTQMAPKHWKGTQRHSSFGNENLSHETT
jgi:hypothetical protein